MSNYVALGDQIIQMGKNMIIPISDKEYLSRLRVIPISCQCGWEGILEELIIFLQIADPWRTRGTISNSKKIVKLKECFDREEFGEVLSFACPECAKGSLEIPKEYWDDTNRLLITKYSCN